MCSSADASLSPSPATAHASWSMWIATPSSYRTCTDYSLPVSRRTAKDSGHYPREGSPVFGADQRVLAAGFPFVSKFGLRVVWADQLRYGHDRPNNKT